MKLGGLQVTVSAKSDYVVLLKRMYGATEGSTQKEKSNIGDAAGRNPSATECNTY